MTMKAFGGGAGAIVLVAIAGMIAGLGAGYLLWHDESRALTQQQPQVLAATPAPKPIRAEQRDAEFGVRHSGFAGETHTAETMPQRARKSVHVGDVEERLIELMRRNPEDALRELGALDASVRMSIAGQVLAAGVDRAPELCGQWMLEHLPRRALMGAAEEFSERWITKNPRAAIAWLVEQGEMANEMLGPIFASALGQQMKGAGVELLIQMPAHEMRDDLVPTVIAAWAQLEPVQAVVWAMDHSESTPRAVAAAVRTWAESDLTAARQWMESQAPSGARDQAIIGYSDCLVQSDGPGALEWSQRIADANVRTTQQRILLDEWMTLDGDAAEGWLRTNQSVPVELRQEILGSRITKPLRLPAAETGTPAQIGR